MNFIADAIKLLWCVFLAVWLVGAFSTKRTVRSQPTGERLLQIAIGVCVWSVAISHKFGVYPLNLHVLPQVQWARYSGLLLVIVGIAFAIWARIYLGGNWSASVTVKEGHNLVTSGPYSIVRHPIYSGLLLAILGTVVAMRTELRGLIGLTAIFIIFLLKSRTEETFMQQEFGARYSDYRRRVKALIPFVY